jgi:hypothetical protein
VSVLGPISWSWRDTIGPTIGGRSRAPQLVMEGYNRPAGYTGTQVVLPTGRLGDKGPSAGYGRIQLVHRQVGVQGPSAGYGRIQLVHRQVGVQGPSAGYGRIQLVHQQVGVQGPSASHGGIQMVPPTSRYPCPLPSQLVMVGGIKLASQSDTVNQFLSYNTAAVVAIFTILLFYFYVFRNVVTIFSAPNYCYRCGNQVRNNVSSP